MKVYKITNIINGMSYIGQTVRSPEKRWKEHQNKAGVISNPFYNAIKFYGPENFVLETVCEAASLEELNKKEEELVKNYIYPSGYNLKQGGKNKRYSELSKNKIRMSKIGKRPSEETRKKLSESVKIQNLNNPEILAKRMSGLIKSSSSPGRSEFVSKQFSQLWKNQEFKEKMSKTRKGIKKSGSHSNNIKKGRLSLFSNPFDVFKKLENGECEHVGVWKNVTTCANELDLNYTKIIAVLNGSRKTHKGYFFKRNNLGVK